MVGCNSYRSPGLLAKITSTIDVISGGRLDWGIGAGWYEHEYRGYGYDFPSPKDRIGMLRESVEIVKSMWSQAETTYDGKYYKLDRAQCDPKPLQNEPTDSHWWWWRATDTAGHCAAVGRDEATLRKTGRPRCLSARQRPRLWLPISRWGAAGLSRGAVTTPRRHQWSCSPLR